MELNQAMKIVLELAQQNVITDPDSAEEYQQQADAIETVQLFVNESLGANPSPVKVHIDLDGGLIQRVVSNVPVEVTTFDFDIEGVADSDLKVNLDSELCFINQPYVEVDPQRTAYDPK